MEQKNKFPLVRIWGKHDIISHLSLRPDIKLKYGLDETSNSESAFRDVSTELAKIVSTLHSHFTFGHSNPAAFEYANALSRCWMERISQIKKKGSFFPFPKDLSAEYIDILNIIPANRRFLSRGEILTLLWIAFVTERDNLDVQTSANSVSIKLSALEIDIVLKAASGKAIMFLAGNSLLCDNDTITIEEDLYE